MNYLERNFIKATDNNNYDFLVRIEDIRIIRLPRAGYDLAGIEISNIGQYPSVGSLAVSFKELSQKLQEL